MKKYIALKAMKFDKSYQKGTEVPENVIAKDMRNKLLRCGALAVEITVEQEKKPEEQNTEETEKTPEQQEQINQISEQQQTEQTPQPQTEEQLLQYKKEELEQIAEQRGIEVKQSMTKADIVALLLQEE